MEIIEKFEVDVETSVVKRARHFNYMWLGSHIFLTKL